MMRGVPTRMGCTVLAATLGLAIGCGGDDTTTPATTAPATTTPTTTTHEASGVFTGEAAGRAVIDGVEVVMSEVHACRDPSADDETTAHGGQLLDLRAVDSQGNVFRATAYWSEDWHTEMLRWFVGDDRYQELIDRPWDETGWFPDSIESGDRIVGSGELVGFDGTEGTVTVEFDLGVPESEQDCPRDPFHYVPVVTGF